MQDYTFSHVIMFVLILQRTSRCDYELKTNSYSSIKHNHVSYSAMTTCFGLKGISSEHYYKNLEVRNKL